VPRDPLLGWTLLPRRTVGDRLLHRRVYLLGRDQYDGLKLHSPRGVDRQRDRRGGDTIWHVGNNEKIVATIGMNWLRVLSIVRTS
jgi:hypothetical protein